MITQSTSVSPDSLPFIHHFPTHAFNWYVLEEAGRFTIIDAGFPGHYDTLTEGLSAKGKSLSDIEAVLLTHAHADHTGFASRLQRELRIPIYLHPADTSLARRPMALPLWELSSNAWRPNIRGMLLHSIAQGVLTCPTLTSTHPLHDAAELDVPGRPVVIHAPGHTPGEVAFWIPRTRTLITGDAIVTMDLKTGRTDPPVLASFNADRFQARRSLERLRGLSELTLHTGHGPAWSGHIDQAIEAALSQETR